MDYREHLTEKERKYNELCGIVMTNIFTITKNCDTIPFFDIDPKNEDELFFLSVGIALGGAINKKVTISGSKFKIWKLNRILGIKEKNARITQMPAKDSVYCVFPQLMIKDLLPIAKEVCGADFKFADIYNDFYKRKE